METRLGNEPLKITRNQKVLRPNPLGRFELRSGDLRVFYNVDEGSRIVLVLRSAASWVTGLLSGARSGAYENHRPRDYTSYFARNGN